ncbi:MAG TPA: hypothetical protein VF054_06635 [Micromonosporaceae bacterium]
MAYTLLRDQVEQRALNERLVAATFKAAGGDGDLPTVDDALDEFETWLNEPPEPVDPERAELLAALRVGGRR